MANATATTAAPTVMNINGVPVTATGELLIHEEYQVWALFLVTILAIWLSCLPCFLSGCAWVSWRRAGGELIARLPLFLVFITVVNVALIYQVVALCPDFTMADYLDELVAFVGYAASHIVKLAISGLIIMGFVILWTVRERLAVLLGIEHVTFVRFSIRSFFGGSREEPYRVHLWRVYDLPALNAFSANDVYCEIHAGMNQPMTTRVHSSAGTQASFKQALDFNIDVGDPTGDVTFLLKDQGVMVDSVLARGTISVEDALRSAEDDAKRIFMGARPGYNDEWFREVRLKPSGTLKVRFEKIEAQGDDTQYDPLLP